MAKTCFLTLARAKEFGSTTAFHITRLRDKLAARGGKVPYWRLRYVRKSIEKNAKEAP